MERAAARGDVDAYSRGQPRVPRPLVELAGNAKLLAHCTGGSSTSCISTAARRWRRPATCRFRRASIARSSSGSPPGKPAAAGRALLRPRHGEPRTDAPRARRRRAPPRRGPAAPAREKAVNAATASPSTAAPTAGPSARWSSSASTAASPTTSTRRSAPGARRSSPSLRDTRHLPHRRLRRAVVHQSEQPVDRHRRAAVGARHLRQLLLGPRRRAPK